ncbi:MAG: PAS domain S-box protein [Hyphomicrobiales bacterium]
MTATPAQLPPEPLIVAIAASGANLEDLSAVLAAIPIDAGLAIIVARRAETGGGLQPEDIAPLTALPVTPIVDGVPLLPGHLYVMPARGLARIEDGRLILRSPRKAPGGRTPADAVFHVLARDVGPRSVGVLLAGDGSDGALGLMAIAAAGGVTMAQAIEAGRGEPAAGHDTGCGLADRLLAPREIGRELLDYARFRAMAEADDGPARRRRGIKERLAEFSLVLRRQSGLDFALARMPRAERRIERRMGVLRLASVDAYAERLSGDAGEAHALCRELYADRATQHLEEELRHACQGLEGAGGRAQDGAATGIAGQSDDVAARQKAEAALAESERNFRLLFEQAAVGIEQAALDGKVTGVNDRLCAMLGYSREELLTKTFVDITDPADLPRERRRHKRLYSGKVDSYVFEKRYVRRNGTRLWARVTCSLARDRAGEVLYRISFIEDVSERRRAQQELRESEARYRATFDQAAIGIAHVGLDGRWLAVNDRLYAITGYTRDEMLSSRFQDITHPDDLDNNLAGVAALVRGDREILALEKRYLRKDGAVVWVSLTSAVVRNDDGAPAYLISVIEDITEDRRAALTDARLAAIVRSSQDAIFSFDHDDIIGSWNSGAEQLFGYRSDEIIGKSHAILVPPHKLQEARDALARLAAGETVISIESERMRKDGTVFPCVVTKSQIHASSGKLLGFSSIVRDITERRRWEEQQRLMARELVHRVKNSFAVIQSIVRQTQRSTPDPEAFASAFSGRLAAMAASHDLLTDRHWEGASLRDLVSSQLAAFAAGGEKRVRAEGPDVTLDTSLAVPLGLALHELATNATKYGSLSKPGGKVEVSWTVSRAGKAEHLSLVWRESGGPRVAAPKRRGFGTSQIERGLPDATIERRFEPEGLVCRIDLPTSGVRAETD